MLPQWLTYRHPSVRQILAGQIITLSGDTLRVKCMSVYTWGGSLSHAGGMADAVRTEGSGHMLLTWRKMERPSFLGALHCHFSGFWIPTFLFQGMYFSWQKRIFPQEKKKVKMWQSATDNPVEADASLTLPDFRVLSAIFSHHLQLG